MEALAAYNAQLHGFCAKAHRFCRRVRCITRHGLQAASATGDPGAGNADGYDADAQKEIDARSIYVGNVEYTIESAQLAEFFGVRSSPDAC